MQMRRRLIQHPAPAAASLSARSPLRALLAKNENTGHFLHLSPRSQSVPAARRLGKRAVGVAAAREPLAGAPRQRPFSSQRDACSVCSTLGPGRAAEAWTGAAAKAFARSSKRDREAPPQQARPTQSSAARSLAAGLMIEELTFQIFLFHGPLTGLVRTIL